MFTTKYPTIGQLKTVAAFRARLAELGLSLPVDETMLTAAAGSPLATPLEVAGVRVGNRWCIQPMEGWDANRDGSPSAHMLRLWRNFGLSGAKLIWGDEAAAVQPGGRANPHQTLATPENRAGFAAYSVGGYALVGARYGLPDIGLVGFGEMSAGIRDIMAASSLPVLIDCDDGYGDAKNVARTVTGYEAMGVSAIFMEDQRAPKRCGHMAGKDVIEADVMTAKLRAAVDARESSDLFIIARTDARAVHGLDDALRRAEMYLKAGADGLFIEAPQSVDELAQIGRTFQGVPQIANMLEGGGRTPVLPPHELYRLGFAMIAYPTSLIFRVARTIETALADLKAGRPADNGAVVDFEAFKDIVSLARWAGVERRSGTAGK